METASVHQNPLLLRRKGALAAGTGLLTMFVAAMVAEFAFHKGLIVTTDAALTAANIGGNHFLAVIGLLCFLLVAACDVLVAWGLYRVFSPAQPSLSKITAWLRIGYTAVFLMAISHLIAGYVMLLQGAEATNLPRLQADALAHFQTFDTIWAIALVVFGLHLVVLGRLVMRAKDAPKVLGLLLLIAGCAYSGDNLLKLLWSGYPAYQEIFIAIVALPGMVSELWLAVWLLVFARRQR